MTTLIKLIIGLTLSLANITAISSTSSKEVTPIILENNTRTEKETAYQILNNKCNVCHIKRNKRRVFTLENMTQWADDIHRQVFIKKRMPKGKKIKLTTTEYQQLLTWITTTKNQ